MNIHTQKKIVFKLLLNDFKNGAKGVNSVYIRETYGIVDVATRMFDNKPEFRKLGLRFDKRRQPNGTATYFLKVDELVNSASKQALKRIVQPQKLTKWESFVNSEGYEVMREVTI